MTWFDAATVEKSVVDLTAFGGRRASLPDVPAEVVRRFRGQASAASSWLAAPAGEPPPALLVAVAEVCGDAATAAELRALPAPVFAGLCGWLAAELMLFGALVR